MPLKTTILSALALLHFVPSVAMGRGAAFLRVSANSGITAEAVGVSGHNRSAALASIRLGRSPGSGWYYSGGPAYFPQSTYCNAGFRGTDIVGSLYVNGYRVLPSGWLKVQVEPLGAEVLIDGFPIQVLENPIHCVDVRL